MRYTPFEDIDRLVDRMMDRPGARGWAPWMETWESRMDVDVAEYDDEIVVMADLPGYDRENIDVTIDEGTLTIRAEREHESEHGTGPADDSDEEGREIERRAERAYLRRERRHESVSRRIDLPRAVREEDAAARYSNGVLTVTLPFDVDESADAGHRIDVE